MELTFFTAAMSWICGQSSWLIMLQCFGCCRRVLTEGQGLLPLLLCIPSNSSGNGKNTGRGHSWCLWPKLASGIFHTSMFCNKNWGGKGAGLASKVAVAQSLLRHLSSCANAEWLSLYQFPPPSPFPPLIKLSLSWPTSFSFLFPQTSVSPVISQTKDSAFFW